MNKVISLIKKWTLLVSMVIGMLGYLIFHYSPSLNEIKPAVISISGHALPVLLFLTLFLTFCKVRPSAIVQIRRWHIRLLLIQAFGSVLITTYICLFSPEGTNVFPIALLIITICPNAAGAAVITGKLGGSETTVTTYTILSNILASIAIPLLFPLAGAMGDGTFFMQFLAIIMKTFPILILPLLLAWGFRFFLPNAHAYILKRFKGVAFYIWAINLMILMGQGFRTLVNEEGSFLHKTVPMLAGLLCCIVFFPIGKRLGRRDQDSISSGQGLGQKNTIFAIWITMIYFNPIMSLAPVSYVVWQNIVNSWELGRHASRIKN